MRRFLYLFDDIFRASTVIVCMNLAILLCQVQSCPSLTTEQKVSYYKIILSMIGEFMFHWPSQIFDGVPNIQGWTQTTGENFYHC